MNLSAILLIPIQLWEKLRQHLFREEFDEHGAVIAAGVVRTDRGVRLLARDVFLAEDGVDYLPGQRGYRMLRPEFIRDCAIHCRDEKLAYLAVHNHMGDEHVQFSSIDNASHERGYPALLEITGQVVGGLVFTENASAGDIWLPNGDRILLERTRIIGSSFRELYPSPPPAPQRRGEAYDRQARIFGDRGQEILGKLKVGVIGAGGVGSLINEFLSRLGVGHVVIVDPDTIELSNLPRVVGSTEKDVELECPKAEIACRVSKEAQPRITVDAIRGDFLAASISQRFRDCDYLFLAADPMQPRLLFNALVHQYLIPGVQLGSKVPVDKRTGEVGRVFSVVRPVAPVAGCLLCNGFIVASRLQQESISPEERRAQMYVEEAEVVAPSVITLNAVAASQAVNDFLFRVTGLRDPSVADEYVYFEPRSGSIRYEVPRKDPSCHHCGNGPRSVFARGDSYELPNRSERG